MRKSKKLITLSIMIMLIAVSNIVSVSSQQEETRYGGTLKVSLRREPTSLNGITIQMTEMHYITDQIQESLLLYDRNYNPLPSLAQSWEISDDGKTVTFYLVENATWHDGEPFTSADVKFNYDEMIKYGPAGAQLDGVLESVEATDDYTIVFQLANPSQSFMMLHGPNWVPLSPKHLYEGTDILENPYNWEPVGTGPFIFDEYIDGDHALVVRNPNYWKKGLPYLDSIYYKIIPDEYTSYASFLTGETDFSQNFPIHQTQEIAGRQGMDVNIALLTPGGMNVDLIWFNLRNAPLNDILVRKAINYAIDKEAIVETAFYNVGNVTYGGPAQVDPSTDWYRNDAVFAELAKHDVEMANDLLDDAGYLRGADGIRFSLELLWSYVEFDAMAPTLKDNLAEIGIDLTLLRTTHGTRFEKFYKTFDFDLCALPTLGGPNPRVLRPWYHSEYKDTGGVGQNPEAYDNTEFDLLIDTADMQITREAAGDLYKQAMAHLANDLPAVYIHEKVYPIAYDTDFIGLSQQTSPGMYIFGSVYWTKGHEYSQEQAVEAISIAKNTIVDLKADGHDVSNAESKLSEAENALTNLDYTTAKESADSAPALAIAPETSEPDTGTDYTMYGIVAVVIIIVIAVLVYQRRK